MQRYHCAVCRKSCDGRVRVGGERLLAAYLHGKQTYRQLARTHGCSVSTVRRKLERLPPPAGTGHLPASAVVVLDTTYFGRGCGFLLLKDAATGANLLAAVIEQETVAAYQTAVAELERRHCRVLAIVCDGRRGLFTAFGDRPVQMCQFHQLAIIRRHLTRRPKLPAARELWHLAAMLPRMKEEDFIAALERWHARWQPFLDQRTVTRQRSRYTHPRLRSALLSLKRHLPWLFTCLRHPRLQLPNTTNALDGHFAELKNKLRNHNGLAKPHRQNLILHLLAPAIIHHFDH